MKDFPKPVVMTEGDLAFNRWTIRILCGFCVLLGIVSGVSVLQVDRLSHKVTELQKENADLKAKLLLKGDAEGDAVKTVSVVTDMIAQLGKRPQQEAEHTAYLEVGYAEKYKVDLATGLAISFHESKWDPSVVSENGSSVGIKQVNYKAWRDKFRGMTFQRLQNPDYNVSVGYALLADHIKQYGSINLALQRYRGSPDPAVNAQYADDVLRTAHAIRRRLLFSQS